MFKQLRNKFLFTNMVLTLLILTATFSLLISIVYWNARQDASMRLQALPSSAVQNNMIPVPASGSVVRYMTNIVLNGEQLGSSTFFKITVTADGNLSKSNPNYWMMEEAYKKAAQIAWRHQNPHKVISLGRSWWQAIVIPSAESKGDYDIFFMEVTASQSLLHNLLYTFLGIVPLTLIAVFFISKRIAIMSVRPISEAWEKQRQFIADASHELKTPLAIIQANADALALDGDSTLENRKKWIGYIKDETTRMSGLVNELLYLAKVEGNKKQEIYSEFDLGQCAADICTTLEALIYEKNITLECDIKRNVIVCSSEPKIQKILAILLDNAIKYTNEGGFIRVGLTVKKSLAEVVIENSGAGISAVTLPHIFDRFYRADMARENEDGSYGLGLSIAKNLSDQLGLKLTARSIPNEKTTFMFNMKVIC
jgi:two-component system, OmpR family, sensor histidine kinase CiaH